MTVRRRDLRAVRVEVHRCERVQETPHTGAEEGHHRRTQGPQHRGLVRDDYADGGS